jgi:hypothetical protein
MADTNYIAASRYILLPGSFNLIEHNTRTGNTLIDTATGENFYDSNITTKEVKDTVNLDLLLYDFNVSGSDVQVDTTRLYTDLNKSVGVFLATYNRENNDALKLITFLGSYLEFDTYNGRIPVNAFSTDHAYKEAWGHFYYSKIPDENWTECWSYNGDANSPVVTKVNRSNFDTYCGESDSYDKFAIRPKRFIINTTGIGTVLKAGIPYVINYIAEDRTGSDTKNYNETENTSFAVTTTLSPDPGGCVHPALERNTTIRFHEGRDSNATVFTNVGRYLFKIHEVNGSEFAKVDANDTSYSQRIIEDANTTFTIVPSDFNMTITFTNKGNGYTYVSEINSTEHAMAATLHADIQAVIADGSKAENYESDCFADSTKLSLNYDISRIIGTLTHLLTYEANATTPEGNFSLPTTPSSNIDVGPIYFQKSIFSSSSNGATSIDLKINFNRSRTRPVNPFVFKINDVNLSEQDNDMGSTATVDQSATYLYGRIHAPRYKVSASSGSLPVYYQIYYDVNPSIDSNTSLGTFAAGSDRGKDSFYWYKNDQHQTPDGNITSVSQFIRSDLTLAPTTTSVTNGIQHIDYTYNGSTYPYRATIHINSQPWLIYNRYNSSANHISVPLEINNNTLSDPTSSTINDTGDSGATDAVNRPRRIQW